MRVKQKSKNALWRHPSFLPRCFTSQFTRREKQSKKREILITLFDFSRMSSALQFLCARCARNRSHRKCRNKKKINIHINKPEATNGTNFQCNAEIFVLFQTFSLMGSLSQATRISTRDLIIQRRCLIFRSRCRCCEIKILIPNENPYVQPRTHLRNQIHNPRLRLYYSFFFTLFLQTKMHSKYVFYNM